MTLLWSAKNHVNDFCKKKKDWRVFLIEQSECDSLFLYKCEILNEGKKHCYKSQGTQVRL